MSKEEMILKLMQLALKIESETNRYVFVHYFGHVNSIVIYIAKMDRYDDWLYSSRIYFDFSDCVEQFNEVCESLNKYIA